MKIIVILLLAISFNALSFEGMFIVPTDDESLEYFSKFRITNIDIDPNHLSFTMPAQLASDEAHEVKFERNDLGENRLNSYFGSAHCLQESKKIIKCTIDFNLLYQKVLVKSLYKTLNYVQANTEDIYDLTHRLIVAEKFSGAPHGILLVKIDSL